MNIHSVIKSDFEISGRRGRVFESRRFDYLGRGTKPVFMRVLAVNKRKAFLLRGVLFYCLTNI